MDKQQQMFATRLGIQADGRMTREIAVFSWDLLLNDVVRSGKHFGEVVKPLFAVLATNQSIRCCVTRRGQGPHSSVTHSWETVNNGKGNK